MQSKVIILQKKYKILNKKLVYNLNRDNFKDK